MGCPRPRRGLPFLYLLIAASGCTTAPTADRISPQKLPPAQREPQRVSWLCAQSPTRIALAELGVPASSIPVDVVLTPEDITILLEPARLVILPRHVGAQSAQMMVGARGDSWRAIDRDPSDGALWVVSSETVDLLRIGRDGRQTTVRIPSVVGPGGFSSVRAGVEGLYVVSPGADHAVWRIDRSGKVIERAFPRPVGSAEPLEVGKALGGILGRGPGASVVLFFPLTGEIHRAEPGGGWTLLPARFAPAPAEPSRRDLRVEGRGTALETWFFASDARGIFFIGEDPILLGSETQSLERRGQSLQGLREGREQFAIEDCAGGGIRAVDADEAGFAAVTIERTWVTRSGAGPGSQRQSVRGAGGILLLGRWSERPQN